MSYAAPSRQVMLATLFAFVVLVSSCNDPPAVSRDVSPSVAQATVLGLVEGSTEFLPVSSTGHLVVTERILGLDSSADRSSLDAYTVVIQFGAILAVVGLFKRRIRQMISGVLGRDEAGRRLVLALVVAFLPIAVVGFFVGDFVDQHLLEPAPVSIAWISGGLVILAMGRWLRRPRQPDGAQRTLDELKLGAALTIGVVQVMALWPGISRSLVTITGGVLVGLAVPAAVEFSFLLGAVTLTAATALASLQDGRALIADWGVVTPLVGVVVAGATAWLSIKWLTSFIATHSLRPFGWYRIGIGLATLAVIGIW